MSEITAPVDDALSGMDSEDADVDVTKGAADELDTDITKSSDETKADKFSELFGAPEEGSDYDGFTVPEGVAYDESGVKDFASVARSLNLSQAGAQKLVDWAAQRQQTVMADHMAALEEEHTKWRAQVRSDPEVGGAKLQESLTTARSALSVIDPTGELNEVLKATKLGSHPAVLKALVRAGKAVGEAQHRGRGDGGGSGDEVSLADRLYSKAPGG